jgi:recombination DNA repair RAD52 pathway protein
MIEYLTVAQVEQLLKPLNPSRIERLTKAGQTLSYLNHADVRAHLTRIFGFARWSSEVLETRLLFEEQVPIVGKDGKPEVDKATGEVKHRWYIGWQARLRMEIHNPQGVLLAVYTEAAIGSNTQPQRGEASDMALKSAVSDALKRCAMNLGDQFGLGLYAKGSTGAMVKATLVHPVDDDDEKVSDAADIPEPEPEADDSAAQLEHSLGVAAGGGDYADEAMSVGAV